MNRMPGSKLTVILYGCVIAVFVVAEIVIVVVSMHVPNRNYHWSSVLANMIVLAVPAVAALRGFKRVRELSTAQSGIPDERVTVQLSRDFLYVAIGAYAAIVLNVVLLAEALLSRQ